MKPERVGPYLRALSWGLHALAPSEDFVPLQAARAHLEALDPSLSGGLLAPAEVDPSSGLPAYPWLERAQSEAVMARRGSDDTDPSEVAIERARSLDPALGERLASRRALHRHLRRHPLLASSHLSVAVRRLRPSPAFRLSYDRIFLGAGWMRLVAELEGGQDWRGGELFTIQRDDTVHADPGLQHLFARHSVTPLTALLQQLQDATGARVTRLSRGFVGPFWFPGGPLLEDLPAWAEGALCLHLGHAVLGEDVYHSAHRDPWVPPVLGERVPAGLGLFRERRFAVSPHRVAAAQAWCRGRGQDALVLPLRPA